MIREIGFSTAAKYCSATGYQHPQLDQEELDYKVSDFSLNKQLIQIRSYASLDMTPGQSKYYNFFFRLK